MLAACGAGSGWERRHVVSLYATVMVLAAFLFLTALAAAQTNDARALLQEIASSTRATQSWRAEGIEVSEVAASGIQLRNEVRFKVAIQGPSKMRWETSGDDDTLMVCDGTDHWTYYQHGLSFYRDAESVSPCKPSLGDFSQVTDNLTSAVVIGRDQVQIADAPQECELVRAEYTVPVPPGADPNVPGFLRTFCIDTARGLVLRETSERTTAKGLGLQRLRTALSSAKRNYLWKNSSFKSLPALLRTKARRGAVTIPFLKVEFTVWALAYPDRYWFTRLSLPTRKTRVRREFRGWCWYHSRSMLVASR